MPKSPKGKKKRTARRACGKAQRRSKNKWPGPTLACPSPPKKVARQSAAAKMLLARGSSILKDTYLRVFGEKYTDRIKIKGSKDFRKIVKARLKLIEGTESGRLVLRSINNSTKKLTIKETEDDNSYAGPKDWVKATTKGKPVFFGNGEPLNKDGKQMTGTGEGSDSVVELNPSFVIRGTPSGLVPNDAILFHEMKHAARQMQGIAWAKPLDGGWTTLEERVAISTGVPSEADYLRERGYEYRRTSHSDTFTRIK